MIRLSMKTRIASQHKRGGTLFFKRSVKSQQDHQGNRAMHFS